MQALLRGGSQERNRRAGTENVAGAVGLGRASELAERALRGEADPASRAPEAARLAALRDRLEVLLLEVPGAAVNGAEPRVANTTNVSFEGADAEALVAALDLMGVAVSTGAACAAGAVEPSHVLLAMGLSRERVQGSLRFSLGRGTTPAEVDRAAEAVREAVEKQRRR
jgi:cysteine desulfurase